MGLDSKSKGIYLKIHSFLIKNTRFLYKKSKKSKKDIIEYLDRFHSL